MSEGYFKFGFRIRTKGGMLVDNLLIAARDRDEAGRKLNQIYVGCEILESREPQPFGQGSSASFEDVVSLISRQEDPPREA